jgi:hypothetical protein
MCNECTGLYSDILDLVELRCHCICHHNNSEVNGTKHTEKSDGPSQPVPPTPTDGSHHEEKCYDY